MIDRIYLESPGWRGIRERKTHVETLLRRAIEQVRAEERPIHILDPAAGGGRYVLDAVNKLREESTTVTLRDRSPASVDAARMQRTITPEYMCQG